MTNCDSICKENSRTNYTTSLFGGYLISDEDLFKYGAERYIYNTYVKPAKVSRQKTKFPSKCSLIFTLMIGEYTYYSYFNIRYGSNLGFTFYQSNGSIILGSTFVNMPKDITNRVLLFTMACEIV